MKIDLFVDLTCPFCYVSKLILEDLKQEFNLEINYHVIRINKDVIKKELLVERYPQSISVIPSLNSLIEEYNKNIKYEYKVNSFNPTMLYYNLYSKNKIDAYKLLFELNEDYFTNNIDISDLEYIQMQSEKYDIELLDLTTNIHLDATEQFAYKLGVSGTPFMLINDKFMVSGVRSKADLVNIFQKLNMQL